MRTVLNHFGNSARRADVLLGEKNVACALRTHWLPGISALFFAGVTLAGCSPKQEATKIPQDKLLASYQTNLLQTAFDVATAMPVVPHIKDRSRAQEAVVTACLELNQPQRALSYIEKIGNWRKGLGYADYAFYSAEHGFTTGVQHYLNLAEEISTIADQDWRRDRIRVRIAQTHLLVGQAGLAKSFSDALEPSETGKSELIAAQVCPEDGFDDRMGALDKLIASGDFDLKQNALKAAVQLYDRFFSNESRRIAVEEKLKASWTKTPYFIRIELLSELADSALDHSDFKAALRLVSEARDILKNQTWLAEHQIPIQSRLAALSFRCGDSEMARAEIHDALTFFDQKHAEIINIDRGNALVPVAEAFVVMDDQIAALMAYKQAVEVSVENPNSRPRAEDLTAICISLAVNGVEPDEALWSRIREIQANLGDPW